MGEVILSRGVGGGEIRLVQGDITLATTDAIVNAANSALQHGGGVAGAIVRRGGRVIQEESNRIGRCPEGSAVVTGAGSLATRYVIHAVGPLGSDPEADSKLTSAVRAAFARAEELGLTSISLPAISSGIFGFPKDRCARILLREAEQWLTAQATRSLRRIDFCIIDDVTVQAFADEWRTAWPET
ncbi:MAG: macro domain-containing protein [Armatimonadetes bacterium]|nr:macro domain-containing protein [Armatimonadota bacterium]